jgi:preprotein translocase subunit SecE
MATQAAKMEEQKPPSELTRKVTGTVQGWREFLQETRAEMKKVTWPTRNDVVSTTGVVIATVFFFGVFLWLVDMGVNNGVQYIFHKFGL